MRSARIGRRENFGDDIAVLVIVAEGADFEREIAARVEGKPGGAGDRPMLAAIGGSLPSVVYHISAPTVSSLTVKNAALSPQC